jgi:hypothetical protein
MVVNDHFFVVTRPINMQFKVKEFLNLIELNNEKKISKRILFLIHSYSK